MIRSMTAYARREIKGDWGSAAWELRSVNQRYLETYFRLPEQFRSLEPVVRERIRSRLTRGKIECTLRFEQDPSAQGELILNENLAKQLVNAANWVKMQSDEGEINPVDILRWPGVMAAQEQDLDAIAAEILNALNGALDDFIVARETEGQALKTLIEQRLEGVSAEVSKVRAHMPEILQWQRERLVAKLEDAEVQLENNRLEQELVLMAQRIDVAEELDRLEAHVKALILNIRFMLRRRCYRHLYVDCKPKWCRPRAQWCSLHDAGVQPRVEYSGVKIHQCRRDQFSDRAEGADRADARADSEYRVMSSPAGSPYGPALFFLITFKKEKYT